MLRDWENIRFLHTFLPIENTKEPNILPFIDTIQQSHPFIQLVVSKSDLQHFSMKHILYNATTDLQKNKWGIWEPVAGDPIEEWKLDAVLVPLLVCDNMGNRVGYGKGFYDRFLSNCRKDCRKIGVSFFEPLDVPIEDVASHDVPLDEVVFPGGIRVFTPE